MSLTILTTLLVRELALAEAQLSELTGPLARHAQQLVHEALADVETIKRLETRGHHLGDRAA